MATIKYTDMPKPLESQFTYVGTGLNKPMYDSWMDAFNSSSTHPDAVAYRAKQYSDKYASVVNPDGTPVFDPTFYNGLATGTIPQSVADTQVKDWATDLLAKDPNINWNLSGGANDNNKTFVAERNKLIGNLSSNRNYVGYNQSQTDIKTTAEKAATEKAVADKTAADKAIADQAAAEKAATEKAVADKTAADKAIADQAVADKAVADQAAADKVANDLKWSNTYADINKRFGTDLGATPTTGTSALPTGGTGMLTTSSIGALPTGGTGALPTTSLGALPTTSLGALPTGGTGALPTTSLGALPTTSLGALPTGGTGALPTTSLGALPTGGTGALPTTSLGALPTTSLGALPTGGTGSTGMLTSSSIGALGTSNLAALTGSKLPSELTAKDLGVTLDVDGVPKVSTANITDEMVTDALKNTPTNVEYNEDGTPKIVKPDYSTIATSDVKQITAADVVAPIVDRTGTQSAADIAKLVDAAKSVDVNVTPDSLVSNRLSGLLSKNNPYIQQAVNAANLQSSRRGMLNTGAAAGFAQDAAIKNALPIAQADALTIAKANEANAAAKNTLINTGLDLKSKGLISDTGNNVTLNTTQAKLTLDANQYDVSNKLTADKFNADALNKVLTDNNAILNAEQKDGFDTWAAMAQADTLAQSNTYRTMLQAQMDALKEGAKDANAVRLALVNGNVNLALNIQKAITDAVAADSKTAVDAQAAATKVASDAGVAAQLAKTNADVAAKLAANMAAAEEAAVLAAKDAASTLANVNATAAEKEGARLKLAATELAKNKALEAADSAKYLSDAADKANVAAKETAAAKAKTDAEAAAKLAEEERINKTIDATILTQIENLKTDNLLILDSFKNDTKVDQDARSYIAAADADVAKFIGEQLLTPDVTAEAKAKNLNTYTIARYKSLNSSLNSIKTNVTLNNSDAAKTAAELLKP
jgi:hypothetical protein